MQTHTGAQTHTPHTHAWTRIHAQQTQAHTDTWTHGDTHTTHIPHGDRHTHTINRCTDTQTHIIHTHSPTDVLTNTYTPKRTQIHADTHNMRAHTTQRNTHVHTHKHRYTPAANTQRYIQHMHTEIDTDTHLGIHT